MARPRWRQATIPESAVQATATPTPTPTIPPMKDKNQEKAKSRSKPSKSSGSSSGSSASSSDRGDGQRKDSARRGNEQREPRGDQARKHVQLKLRGACIPFRQWPANPQQKRPRVSVAAQASARKEAERTKATRKSDTKKSDSNKGARSNNNTNKR